MRIAVDGSQAEAAEILYRKGADCTEAEKEELGEKYTNFYSELHLQRRRSIRECLDNDEFGALHQWLAWYKSQLEAQIALGAVPVVGWLRLPAIMNEYATSKSKVEAELEENVLEQEQVNGQIQSLLEKQEMLRSRKQQLEVRMKRIDEIAELESESQVIALLGEKEKASLAKLEKQMENPYFLQYLDIEDVSTVFSMFNMDHLFYRFKKNDVDNNLQVTVGTATEYLKTDLKLEFSEAVELLWKLKLLKHGNKEVGWHLSKCGICASTKPGLLLQEYGMEESEVAQILAKMQDWKGFYLATANARSVAAELEMEGELRAKLTTCWVRIQNAHQWNHNID